MWKGLRLCVYYIFSSIPPIFLCKKGQGIEMFLGQEKFKQENFMSIRLARIPSNVQFNHIYLGEPA